MISTIRSTSLELAPRIVTTSHYRDKERRGHFRACVRGELLGHPRSRRSGAFSRRGGLNIRGRSVDDRYRADLDGDDAVEKREGTAQPGRVLTPAQSR